MEHVILMSLFHNCEAGSGGNSAHESLHTPVLKVVVSIDRFFGVMLVVLEVEFQIYTVDAAGRIDFLNSHFSSVFNSLAVNGGAAGDRSDTAYLDGVAAILCAVSAGSEATSQKSDRKNQCKNF